MKRPICGSNVAAAVLAISIVVAPARSIVPDGRSTEASVIQLRKTLQNVLRSIEGTGNDAEKLFGQRKQWCDQAILTFESASNRTGVSLSDMRARLRQTEAEAEEAKAVVKQTKAQMDVVQHAIKQAESKLVERRKDESPDNSSIAFLGSLVETKQLSLSTLESQLDLAIPSLSLLQANIAETKQRISYREESEEVQKDFITALRGGCRAAADRADAQAAARIGEFDFIRDAVQALDSAMSSSDAAGMLEAVQALGSAMSSSDAAGMLEAQAAAASFLQLGDSTQEADDHDLSVVLQKHDDQPASSSKHTTPIQKHEDNHVVTAANLGLESKIQSFLAQLKASASVPSDEESWCSKQTQKGWLALKFAQDSLAHVSSELQAHLTTEGDISEELNSLQGLIDTAKESIKIVQEQTKQEQALTGSSRKNGQLATQILQQALAIVKEIKSANADKITNALESARKMFVAQTYTNVGFDNDAAAKAKAVDSTARDLISSQESELHNLQMTREDHASQRLRKAETKRLLESDVQEATSYMQKLDDACKAVVGGETEQQYAAQTLALEDAEKALQGRLAADPKAALRGAEKKAPQQDLSRLTPMQRAAVEMGVPLEQ